MRIEDITPQGVKSLTKEELLNLHLRVHQLWGAHFDRTNQTRARGLTREDVINAHVTLCNEVTQRKLRHSKTTRDNLDATTRELSPTVTAEVDNVPNKGKWVTFGTNKQVYVGAKTKIPVLIKSTNTDTDTKTTVVVKDFASVVGSTTEGSPTPNDTDILIRADRVENIPTPLILGLTTNLANDLKRAAEALEDADAEEELVAALKQRATEVNVAINTDTPAGFFIRAEDIELPIRKHLDPNKEGLAFHWSSNPQGAHAESQPLCDLVLYWHNQPTTITTITKKGGKL